MPTITGNEIIASMTLHQITINRLATRMNITQKRVREVRSKGVTGECFCKDWQEAIAGLGAFAPKVTLPDGYNGSTRRFFSTPIEEDHDLVRLSCVDAPFMTKWTRKSDLEKALSKSV